MFKLRFLDEAKRTLKKLDRSVSIRILRKLAWLSNNAESIVEEGLRGDLSDFSKLREGDYRILYRIVREEAVIEVRFIGHRSEVYKHR